MKVYTSDYWSMMLIDDAKGSTSKNRKYVDMDGNSITGIILDFHYYKEWDPRNHKYVCCGKVAPPPVMQISEIAYYLEFLIRAGLKSKELLLQHGMHITIGKTHPGVIKKVVELVIEQLSDTYGPWED